MGSRGEEQRRVFPVDQILGVLRDLCGAKKSPEEISPEYAERAEIRNFTGRNTTASYLIILVLTPRIPASGGLVFQRRNFDQRRLAISDMSGSGKA